MKLEMHLATWMQLRFFSYENLVERNKELMRIEMPKTKSPIF